MSVLEKKSVDQWLDSVDYTYLNQGGYIPSQFALEFVNMIKMINLNTNGESNKTPVFHLKMLDELVGDTENIANLCFRGSGKTSINMEYLVFYIAIFGEIPGFGSINGMIYVSDSMENGVKSARKNIETRYHNSDWLKEWIPKVHFTDSYIEFENKLGNKLGVKMYGAKALSLDSELFTINGKTTIKDVCVGDRIFGPDGKLTTILQKSEIFYKQMYCLTLHDGRKLKLSEDHINSVIRQRQDKYGKMYLNKENLTTKEILKIGIRNKNSTNWKFFIENTNPVEFMKKDLILDPYTLGLLLGDGRIREKGSCDLTAHKDDWETYYKYIPYKLGKKQVDTRNNNVVNHTIKNIYKENLKLGINVKGNKKFIPQEYLFSSVEQRLELLKGLMDTDGTIGSNGYCSYSSTSLQLCTDIAFLVRSLGGVAQIQESKTYTKVGIKINLPIFKLDRKLVKQRYNQKNYSHIISIEPIELEPSQCIAVDNNDHQFLTNDFIRTHNTGIRGVKIFGKRPVLAILDDLVSDDDARSKVSMEAIKDTVNKGITHALDPTRRKIIFNGTPFNKTDVLYSAVESGAWKVNVYPVCERFPCSKEDFVGAWEDRFSYEFILNQYEKSKMQGCLSAFNQELMLRISSEEERLIQDNEINWYARKNVLDNLSNFNIYITTDASFSDKNTADNGVISVWALNNNGDYFWLDGICKKQIISGFIDDLFTLVQKYKPQTVGIEISGQQVALISYLQAEMISRNIFFNIARDKVNNQLGLRPVKSKFERFNMVVPLFSQGKFYFPKEMENTQIMKQFVGELRLVTYSGIKGSDDCLDTVSMLMYMNTIKPSVNTELHKKVDNVYHFYEPVDDNRSINSYLVD